MKYKGFYTKRELEARGWTIKMFKDHLPQPHKKIANPRYPDGHPMGLYDKAIVEEIEACPRFQAYSKWANEKFRPRMREVQREIRERRAAQAAQASQS